MNAKAVSLAIVGLFLMASITCVALTAVESDADPTYSVTDDRGVTLGFDEPYKYVVTLGLAFTSTTVSIGQSSKLILVDTGSKDALPEGSNVSTISTSNYTDVGNKIKSIKEDKGIGSLDDILVIMYTYSSSGITSLNSQGINTIMAFYPKSYDDVTKYVEKMETLMGADHSKSKNMDDVAKDIVSKMSDYSGDKVNAIYVSYSSSTYKIANKNSIAVSMFEKCGAVNAGYDAGKSASYEPEGGIGPFLLDKINNGGLKVIFLDGNYTGNASDFVSEQSLGDKDVKVYKLEKTWNSYSPDIADGMTYMSKALYPSVFGSLDDDGKEPFNYTWVIVGVIAAVVVIGAVFIIMRRH